MNATVKRIGAAALGAMALAGGGGVTGYQVGEKTTAESELREIKLETEADELRAAVAKLRAAIRHNATETGIRMDDLMQCRDELVQARAELRICETRMAQLQQETHDADHHDDAHTGAARPAASRGSGERPRH